jgi:hypothetical protein
MTSILTGLLAGILHSHLSRVRFLVDTYYLVLYVTLVYMYVQYQHALCQYRHGAADRALTHVAHVTTAAYSFELFYACCRQV